MQTELPESYFTWLDQSPFIDWPEEDRKKARVVFEQVMTMSKTENAQFLLAEITVLLSYAEKQS